MLTREERIAREQGLANYARAAQQAAEAARELFAAIQMMGGQDPLLLAPLFADAFEALVDEEAPGAPEKAPGARQSRTNVPYEVRAQQVYEALPGTSQEISDAIGDGIKRDGVRAVVEQMLKDPAWKDKVWASKERRDIVRSDGQSRNLEMVVYYPAQVTYKADSQAEPARLTAVPYP